MGKYANSILLLAIRYIFENKQECYRKIYYSRNKKS